MKRIVCHISNLYLKRLQLLPGIVIVFIFSSCHSAKRVAANRYLLTQNVFMYRSAKNLVSQLVVPPQIAPDQLLAYVKQKPNTKIVGLIPLHLLIYNLVDSARDSQRKIMRNQRIDRKYREKNEKRISEGKKPIPESVVAAKKARRTFGEVLMDAGESPVILDSSLMRSSLKQIKLYLQSKGYYNCKVGDSVSISNKKAKVFYIIEPGKPYRINSIKYSFEDTSIASEIYSDTANCLISKGDIFDYDVFQKERDRITHQFNDDGYYAFSRQYVNYKIDSNLKANKMNVVIDIKKYARQDKNNPDSIIPSSHPRYHIRNVTIQMQYNPAITEYSPTDTLLVANYSIVYPGKKIKFKPKILISKIFIQKGDVYQVSNVENTYTGIAQLKAFRYVNVKLVPAESDSNLLDCYIQLMPITKQSFVIEAVGNNTGGDLGIQGDFVYENNSLFRGAEVLQVKLKGGYEAQKLVNSSDNSTINKIIPLNTLDFGPEIDIRIPRNPIKLNPRDNPQSVFKISFDYQDHPTYYSRNIAGGAYALDWNNLKGTQHYSLKFPEINYVFATVYPNFQTQLDSTHNYFLQNSFSNHLITDLAISRIFDDQGLTKKHGFNFLKLSIEESGLILKEIFKNDTIARVPFSYYIKGEADWRHYFVLSKDDKLVFRFMAGAGIPLGNTEEMPFDKSFWAGGSNDIRAWQARSLGPGDGPQNYLLDEIGDIKIEFNQEYRFNLIKFLNLAVFFDEGNIWLFNKNPSIPGGNFDLSGPHMFLREFAWGTGVGFRFDFTYFVFRIDLGFPLHNPSLPKQILFNAQPLYRTVVNFGIGYPF